MFKYNKNQVTIFALLFAFLGTFFAVSTTAKAADNKDKQIVSCKIHTEVQSFYDKDMIEKELKNHDGVTSAFLDLDDHILYVDFNKDKTNSEKICKLIKDLGFEAKVMTEDNKNLGVNN
jgi:copper chaperone CopZ